MKRRLLLSAAAALAVVPALATAQAWPSKPVRIIVPYGAGGAVDIVARVVGQELAKRMGQPFVVENRVGGGSNLASDMVAKSAPDGYTLLMASPANTINPTLYTNMPYDPVKDLVPIVRIGSVPTLLLAAPGFQARDAKEFVALARQKPGHYTYASGGAGTTEHLAGEMLRARQELDIVHVPYKGGAPALNDLMGGQVAVMFTNQLNALPHVQGGKLKALGVASPQRSPVLPDVPTFAELGMADFDVTVWWGLMGPAKMPAEVVARLNKEVREALGSAEMKESLGKLSAQPIGDTPEEFRKFFVAETESWGKVVKASGAKAD